MKKFLKKVLEMVVVVISLGYNFCYADVIVPNSYEKSSLSMIEGIVIGIVIVAIVVTAIMVLIRTKKNRDNKEKDDTRH